MTPHHAKGTTTLPHLHSLFFSHLERWKANIFCRCLPLQPPHQIIVSSAPELSNAYGSSLHEHSHQLTSWWSSPLQNQRSLRQPYKTHL